MPVLHLCKLQGKSQIVQDELVRLGEQMVQSSEATRALALELCREFEDKFLLHVTSGEVRVFFFIFYFFFIIYIYNEFLIISLNSKPMTR
jgi:hypothetical protein